jgi:hypothetical protein
MKKNLIVIFSISAMAVSAQIPLAGMIAGYPFLGNADDSSGYNNNGIIYGATLTAGKLGIPNTAYYFNGSSYIRVPHSPVLDTSSVLTLTAVIKPQGFYIGNCYGNAIIDKGSLDYQPGNYALRFNCAAYGNFNCSFFDSLHENFQGLFYNNPWPQAAFSPYITRDTWYCVAYVFGQDSLKLYIDGIQMWSKARTMALGSNTLDVFIGRKNHNQFPYWFRGVIDDIRIYNRALSFDEIGKYCNVFYNPELSIENVPAENISIIPNPAKDYFTLKLNTELHQMRIEIFNSIGQRVYETLLESDEMQINTSYFSSGIYIVRIGNNRYVHSQKLFID